MRLFIVIALLAGIGGCYTEVQKRVGTPGEVVPIRDTTVFFPDSTYNLSGNDIQYFYGRWINSAEEENSIIKIYRKQSYKHFFPRRFRHEIIFGFAGRCLYLILHEGDLVEYLKYRWRLLKEDPNIVLLYNDMGLVERALRIEYFDPEELSFVWLK